jgi:ATP-grasp ribosomal peptide maturase
VPANHTVLIITGSTDRTADRVAAELALRGTHVVRLSTADFPQQVSMAATLDSASPWAGTVSGKDERPLIDLSRVGAIYWRRPAQFEMREEMNPRERAWAYGEARRGFGGLLVALGLDRALWVNDPACALRAEYKPFQLAVARECGLRIPRTLITSEPQTAYQWAAGLGKPIVYKPMNGVFHADENQIRALYTTPVDDLGSLLDPALALTAHMFQERVPKEFEARAVVVGDKVFAVRIDSSSERGRADWRSDYGSLAYSGIRLPPDVQDSLIQAHRRLGLVYGAADLICEPSGQWVFLETNQRGEWGWLSDETGEPVAEALAGLMEAGPRWAR